MPARSGTSTSWRRLPAVPRALARGVVDAVAAARAEDPALLGEAAQRLAAQDPERVRVVLGGLVAVLLEEAVGDEVGAEAASRVLESCVRRAAAWHPDVDPQAFVVVLTGALGVHDPEEQAPVSALRVAEHAALLLADLLPASARSLDDLLDAALAEVARAEVVEEP
ncbi:hypothetical protein [Quadrisphaera sp. DSM 44207]|uniref:hypothetical protein n=1 Tax=Quadrisphaera sp. DSM 44207 TaxID=1881057 RepID=UPI000888B949|nr:hypothetical protein [Quadrisphaera sp. DSM 44207]SDQ04027.1 hypothetical protein SAMN05428996_0046 [Quadrisphaera sp. DSM 44207]